MWPSVSRLAVAAVLAFTGPVVAAAAAEQPVDAIVVLKARPDLSGLPSGRAARLSAVVRRLQAHSELSQRGLLRLLATRKAQGLVTGVTPLWSVNEVSVRAAPSVLREIATRADVRDIRPETTIQAPAPAEAAAATSGAVEPNVALVHAPEMWDLGFRGQGTVVANLDTGVDATHPDLAARWRGGSNSWYDPNGQHPATPTDVSGHGTQTMGVLVGGSGIGVAPGAQWIAVKIFNDRGSATSTAIHLGFQWLLDPDHNPATADAPNVVNASWTTSGAGCALDFQPDLRALRAAGILPVFAAGNYGPSAGTVYSPANLPEAFAVGDTDNADVLDPYSSRGPSSCAGASAPKLVAPGVGVRTTDLYGGFVADTGTSVAAPHVAGALALLLSAFPGITAERQENALTAGAAPLGAANDVGSGRLDALAAYHWLATAPDFTLTASPWSVTVAPGGTGVYSVTLGAVNGFGADVSLALSGLPGTFEQPVIPGGTGTSRLDVPAPATSGPHALRITATGGGITRTATVDLTVQPPPDFTLAASPSSQSVPNGSGTTYQVALGASNGFTGTVGLALSGLPASVGTAAFTPASVNTAGTSQLALTTSASAPPGSYPLTVTATSGGLTHTASVTLVVFLRDFALAASPSSVTVTRGQLASYSVSASAIGGYTGSVALSVSGAPAGTTSTFTPNPVQVPGTSALRIRTTSSTPRGTYTVRVTGAPHQATVTLVIR